MRFGAAVVCGARERGHPVRIALSLGAGITIGLGTATPALAANQALMINGIGDHGAVLILQVCKN